MKFTCDLDGMRSYLCGLQDDICQTLASLDDGASFVEKEIPGERGGLARPRVLSDGALFERAAVNLSFTKGAALPAAATRRRPDLAGQAYTAASISMIVHPASPYVPTMHANLRLFRAGSGSLTVDDGSWWFGGGFDLTPYYPFEDDAVSWHRVARDACRVLGEGYYAKLKRQCDDYFYLPHRDETRGIGGLFFDDLAQPGFARCFEFARGVGDRLMLAYVPIVERRRDLAFGDRERQWQRYRRGRYVEFNLLHDRGTLFGLQSGGRVESILSSMPPDVHWRYDYRPEVGSPEDLLSEFLRPREWLAAES